MQSLRINVAKEPTAQFSSFFNVDTTENSTTD
jgi:hypothetical protein